MLLELASLSNVRESLSVFDEGSLYSTSGSLQGLEWYVINNNSICVAVPHM